MECIICNSEIIYEGCKFKKTCECDIFEYEYLGIYNKYDYINRRIWYYVSVLVYLILNILTIIGVTYPTKENINNETYDTMIITGIFLESICVTIILYIYINIIIIIKTNIDRAEKLEYICGNYKVSNLIDNIIFLKILEIEQKYKKIIGYTGNSLIILLLIDNIIKQIIGIIMNKIILNQLEYNIQSYLIGIPFVSCLYLILYIIYVLKFQKCITN